MVGLTHCVAQALNRTVSTNGVRFIVVLRLKSRLKWREKRGNSNITTWLPHLAVYWHVPTVEPVSKHLRANTSRIARKCWLLMRRGVSGTYLALQVFFQIRCGALGSKRGMARHGPQACNCLMLHREVPIKEVLKVELIIGWPALYRNKGVYCEGRPRR